MDYIWVVLKPDTLKDGLEQVLISEIEQKWFHVYMDKIILIQKELVKIVYEDKIWTPMYPLAEHGITHWSSMLLFVWKENWFVEMKTLKWKWNGWWLREKYLRYTENEYRDMGYDGRELDKKLAENRIHSTWTINETALLLSLFLAPSQREDIAKISEYLYFLMSKNYGLVKK